MSKFRARQLDASKPIPIYFQEDISDATEFNNVTNRTVPQLPTGMEKEEETEHHLQQAIFHNRVIPVPEVFDFEQENGRITFNQLYPPNFKIPRQMVHIHPFSIDQDVPDYDLDSEDELWLEEHSRKGEMLPLDVSQFEEMMDRLEKASGLKAVTLPEAKLLLKDDDDLITTVYDYWLNKRLRLQHPLIPQIRYEKSFGTNVSSSDPYMAFRKRTEKMQTRKNRKNDEASYEKMLKLRRDLTRAITLLELVKRREKAKRELLHHNIEVHEKRYKMEDFSGTVLNEINSQRLSLQLSRSVFTPIVPNHQNSGSDLDLLAGDRTGSNLWLKVPVATDKGSKEDGKRERRPYKKKRKHLQHQRVSSGSSLHHRSSSPSFSRAPTHPPDPFAIASLYSQGIVSEDELATSHSEAEDESAADGVYAFRRRPFVTYLAPREPLEREESPPLWDRHTPKRRAASSPHKQFYVTSLSHPTHKFIGLARRRVGRGGRVWLDRIRQPLQDPRLKTESSSDVDLKVDSEPVAANSDQDWPHFYPRVSSFSDSSDDSEVDVETVSALPHSPRIKERITRYPRPLRMDESPCRSGRDLDLPEAYFITAEVTDGGNHEGSFTDLHVTLPLVEDLDVLSMVEGVDVDPCPLGNAVKGAQWGSSDSLNLCGDNSRTGIGTVDSESGSGKSGISSRCPNPGPSLGNRDSTAKDVTMMWSPLHQSHSDSHVSFQTQPSSKFTTLDARITPAKSPGQGDSPGRFFYGFESSKVPCSTEKPSGCSVGASSLVHSSSLGDRSSYSGLEASSCSSSLSSSSHVSNSSLSLVSSSSVSRASSFLEPSLSNHLVCASSTALTCPTTSLASIYTSTSNCNASKNDEKSQNENQNWNSKKISKFSTSSPVPFGTKDKLRLESLGLLSTNQAINKNNGSSVLNSTSKLVRSPKFLSSWTSSDNSDPETVLSNGPTTKPIENFAKCPKVTPILFPET